MANKNTNKITIICIIILDAYMSPRFLAIPNIMTILSFSIPIWNELNTHNHTELQQYPISEQFRSTGLVKRPNSLREPQHASDLCVCGIVPVTCFSLKLRHVHILLYSSFSVVPKIN